MLYFIPMLYGGRGDILAGYLVPVATLNTGYSIESQYPVDSFSGGLIGYFGSRSLSAPAGKVLFNLIEEKLGRRSHARKVTKQWKADRVYALTAGEGDLIKEIKNDSGFLGIITGEVVFGNHGFKRGIDETHNMGIPHDFWLGNNPTFTKVISGRDSEYDDAILKAGGIVNLAEEEEDPFLEVYKRQLERYKTLSVDGKGLGLGKGGWGSASHELIRAYHDYLRGWILC